MNTADTITLTVQGMTCGGCAAKVDSALTATDGIAATDITVDTGQVVVKLDGTVPADELEFAIDEAVHQAGYTVAS